MLCLKYKAKNNLKQVSGGKGIFKLYQKNIENK